MERNKQSKNLMDMRRIKVKSYRCFIMLKFTKGLELERAIFRQGKEYATTSASTNNYGLRMPHLRHIPLYENYTEAMEDISTGKKRQATKSLSGDKSAANLGEG